MEKVGIRELRQNASRYIERVKTGESFEVTDRGVPVAMLTPAAMPTLFDRLVATGAIIPAAEELGNWLRENPPLSSDSGLTTKQVLDELREERL